MYDFAGYGGNSVMNAWLRRGIQVGVVAAGLVAFSATGAMADEPDTTYDNFGVANGIQAKVPIQVPVSVCGNGIGILGKGTGKCKGGAHAKISHSKGPSFHSHNNFGLLNGLQLWAPIQVPIDISGNGVGILGEGSGESEGGAWAEQ
jgi:hypothetical protein